MRQVRQKSSPNHIHFVIFTCYIFLLYINQCFVSSFSDKHRIINRISFHACMRRNREDESTTSSIRTTKNDMSSTKNNNNTTTTLIRGGPFSITLLNRIFDFAVADADEALNTYALVCKQWQECEVYYCQGMWKRLSEAKFGKKIKGFRWSFYSYQKRAKSFVFKIIQNAKSSGFERDAKVVKFYGNNHHLDEIENCAEEDENRPDGEPARFRFRCPMIASNLRTLQTEVVPGSDRNVLFCDVCEKRVYPFASKQEVDEFRKKQREDDKKNGTEYEHRCILISKQADEHLQQVNVKNKSSIKNNIKSGEALFNVAVVTSEPESRDCYEGIAERVLAHLATDGTGHAQWIRKGKAPKAFNTMNVDMRKNYNEDDDETVSNVMPMMFMSKDLVSTTFDDNGCRIVARIVRVPPVPAELQKMSETGKLDADILAKYSSIHPCRDDGPLGKNTMPALNGWNCVVLCTESASMWFKDGTLPKKTPSGALKAAGKVLDHCQTASFIMETTGSLKTEKLHAEAFPHTYDKDKPLLEKLQKFEMKGQPKKKSLEGKTAEERFDIEVRQSLVVQIQSMAIDHFYGDDMMGDEEPDPDFDDD